MEIKKTTETIDVYTATCPFCKKEFSQNYEKQLITNIGIHMLTCKENPDNKEEDQLHSQVERAS